MQISFTDTQLDSLFPYYICISANGLVSACGPAIKQAAGNIINTTISETFAWKAADDAQTVTNATPPADAALVLTSKGSTTLLLRGKFTLLPGGQMLIFIGEPLAGNAASATIAATEAFTNTLLDNALEREARLERSKSLFIHTTSHELRTPLTIIQSNAEILKMCLEFPEFQKKKDPMQLIDRITRAVSAMTEILSQLLIISRIESGTIEPEMTEVNVQAFISEVTEHFKPFNDGRTLNVTMKDVPASWVFDPKIMRFALANLLSNAFRYSPHKEAPELSVYTENDELRFRVTDHGIGIPGEDIGKLYQTFFRASNVGKISGTGIGLMVVEYAVDSHGGAIKLETELGKGSTFTLSLPNTTP